MVSLGFARSSKDTSTFSASAECVGCTIWWRCPASLLLRECTSRNRFVLVTVLILLCSQKFGTRAAAANAYISTLPPAPPQRASSALLPLWRRPRPPCRLRGAGGAGDLEQLTNWGRSDEPVGNLEKLPAFVRWHLTWANSSLLPPRHGVLCDGCCEGYALTLNHLLVH